MSSPNAKTVYRFWDRWLIGLHRRASHHRRVRTLINHLAPRVPSGARLLDLGCGDLSLATGLAAARALRLCVGADIWPCRVAPPAGCQYVTIAPDRPLPFATGAFDVVLLIDTLHHCTNPGAVLAEALRVGGTVVVKDHFEYGFWSRKLLQAMDIVGNFGYGVAIPKRYFTPASFDALVAQLQARETEPRQIGLSLYDHLPVVRWVLSPKLHFIASLTK